MVEKHKQSRSFKDWFIYLMGILLVVTMGCLASISLEAAAVVLTVFVVADFVNKWGAL